MAETAIRLPEMTVTGRRRRGYPDTLAKAYHQAYADQLPPYEEFADALIDADPQVIEDMATYLHGDRYDDIDREEFNQKTGLVLYREHMEEPGFLRELMDSFTYSVAQSTPDMLGEATEAAGVLMGSEGLQKTGEWIKNWGEGLPQGEEPELTFQDHALSKDFFRWLGEAMGSGIGSTVAPILTGGLGAAAGAAVAGPPGAAVGGVAGAFASSLPLNMGEVYAQLKQEGISKEDAALSAMFVSPLIAGLDVAGLERLLRVVPGSKALKGAIGQRLGQVVTGAGTGVVTEGATEAGQSAIREALAAGMTNNPDVQARLLNVLNEAAVGAVTGGALGGGRNVVGQEPGPVEADTAATASDPAALPTPEQPGAPAPAPVAPTPSPTPEPAPAEPQQPPMPPEEERSWSSLIMESEAKAGKRKRLDPWQLQVGDRVVVDNLRGETEEGQVVMATENMVRVQNDAGSPIATYAPTVTGETYNYPVYEVLPDQAEIEAQEKEAKKQADDKAQQDEDMAEWDTQAERAIRRIEADPDDSVSIADLRKLKNDKRFPKLPEAEQDRIDDFLLEVTRREDAKKAAEKVEPGQPSPEIPVPKAKPKSKPQPEPQPEEVTDEGMAPAPDADGVPVRPDPSRPDSLPGRPGSPDVDTGAVAPVETDGEGVTVEEADARPPIEYKRVKDDTVILESGKEHAVEYAVVDAKTLVPSHDFYGNINPNYPQALQPRDRERTASQLDVAGWASDLQPRKLAESPVAAPGPPIIDPTGVVESGNGRTIAIQEAYRTGKADHYRAFLDREGYDIEGLAEPVLVRIRRQPMTTGERQAFTREANARVSQGMSRTEQAFADADAMPASLPGLHEGGDLTLGRNRRFVQEFIQKVIPRADRTEMMAKGGELSIEGRQRMEAAILAKAFDSNRLVSRLTESTEQGRATVRNALISISPRWAAMRAQIAAGNLHPDVDQTQALTDAVEMIGRNEQTGRPIAELVQPGMFADATPELVGERGEMMRQMLDLFYRNPPSYTQLRAAKKIAEFLDTFVRQAYGYDGRAPDIFEGERIPQPREMLESTLPREGEEEVDATPEGAEPGADVDAQVEEGDGADGEQPGGEVAPDAERGVADEVGERAEAEPRLSVGIDTAGVTALYPDLVREMDDMVTRMAPGVGLEAVPQARDPQGRFIHGKFTPDQQAGIITVALHGNPTETLRHEIVHALRSAGLFTPKEWASLSRAAVRKGGWIEKYEIDRRYPEYFEADAPSDAAVEEAVADAFGEWGTNRSGFSATVTQLFERIREFFRGLREALRSRELPVSVNSIFEDVHVGIVGARGELAPLADGNTRYSRTLPAEEMPPKLDNAESEARLQEAEKGIQQESLLNRLKDAVVVMRQNLTRHFKNIDKTPKNADIIEKMLQLESQAGAAQERIANIFRRVVGGLNDAQLRTLTRYIIMKDLLWTAEQGMALPFGLAGIDDVALELRKLQAVLDANPDIKERYDVRQSELDRLRMEMVEAGVLTQAQARNPHYFRHQVLSYAKVRQAAGRGKKVSSAYWHSRRGSEKDINGRYTEAEAEWMYKALSDISTTKFLTWLKGSKYDKKAQYIRQAKALNRQNLQAALLADPRKHQMYKDLNRRLAVSMSYLRGAVGDAPDSAIAAMPPELRRQARAIKEGGGGRVDEGTGIFGAVTWFANNSTDKDLANAARAVLGSVNKRNTWVRETAIPEKYVNPMSTSQLLKAFGEDGDVSWQPDSFDGKTRAVHIFTGRSLPEHVEQRMMDRMSEVWEQVMSGADANISPEEFGRFLDAIRDQRMIGGPKYEMVLDANLAETLNDFHDREATEGLDYIMRMAQARWKQWILFQPRRVIKYVLNNRTGDLDALIASQGIKGAPKLAKLVPQAFNELRRFYKNGLPTGKLLEALDKGVVQSGLTSQEVMSASEAMMTRGGEVTIEAMRDSISPVRLTRKYFETVRNIVRLQENAIRYAAYLHYRDQIVDQGKPLSEIGYGATPQWVRQGLSDPLDLAATMARDALGDYGNISVTGQWARNRLVPFVSWMESNTVRYANLFRNAYLYGRDKGAAQGTLMGVYTAGSLLARIGIFYGLVQAWNNVFFGDEEEELSTEERFRLHLHVGRWDGQIQTLRFQGALSDFLGWAGFEDALATLSEVHKGRASLSDMLVGIAKAPVNRIAQGLTPVYKVPIEIGMGVQFYPDVFEPRAIRDPWQHGIRTFSAEHEYAVLAKALGKAVPTRGYGKSLLQALFYGREPGEMAYDQIRGKAYQWLSRQKGRDVPARTDARSVALYLHRKAIRYEDERALVLTKELMRENKVFGQSLVKSKRRAAPLGMLSKADRAAFLRTLTDKERDQLARASAWYRETFWGTMREGGAK